MKQRHQTSPKAEAGKLSVRSCVQSCRNMAARLRAAKESLFAEFNARRETQGRMLWLALNEAEALAWQTGYPHLVFPGLAGEKAESVIGWARRQQLTEDRSRTYAQ